MADSESSEMGLAQTRRSLRAIRTKVKRKLLKLETAVANESSQDLDLEALIDYKTKLEAFSTEYDDDSSLLQATEEDVGTQEAEADEAEYVLFEQEAAEAAGALTHCRLLLAWKRVHASIQDLEDKITSLNDLFMGNPEAHYGAILEDLVKGDTVLRNQLAASRMAEDHPLRGQATEIYRKVNSLRVKVGVPHLPDDKTGIKKTSAGYKRAPLHVPTFSGEMKEYHTFWAAFKLAIHEADDLAPEIKLSYLKSAMKDKAFKEH